GGVLPAYRHGGEGAGRPAHAGCEGRLGSGGDRTSGQVRSGGRTAGRACAAGAAGTGGAVATAGACRADGCRLRGAAGGVAGLMARWAAVGQWPALSVAAARSAEGPVCSFGAVTTNGRHPPDAVVITRCR